MTRHGEESNEFHTDYHSIATYDMVQDSLALTFSFIILSDKKSKKSQPSLHVFSTETS